MTANKSNNPLHRLLDSAVTEVPTNAKSLSSTNSHGMATGDDDNMYEEHRMDSHQTAFEPFPRANHPADEYEPDNRPTSAPSSSDPAVLGNGSKTIGNDGRTSVNDVSRYAALSATEGGEVLTIPVRLFEVLTPAIEQACTFAEQWSEIYRPEIFRVVLERLLDGNADAGTRFGMHIGRRDDATVHGHAGDSARTGVGGMMEARGVPRSQSGPLGPSEKLARALGIDTDAAERTVHIGDEGQVSILGRLQGKTKKELQTKYTLVYLYVKEMALGARMVDVEELRKLCIEQGCYDAGNFTGNYKKDVGTGLIREDGAKGARTRRYMLGQKGVSEGSTLLRTMVDL